MYAIYSPGSSLSPYVAFVETQHEQIRSLERSTIALGPTIKPVGLVHNVTDHATYGDAWRRWNGSAWTDLLDPETMQINRSGTVTYTASQPMGGFLLTGLGAGTAAGHSVRYEQVLLLSGANPMAADLAMGTHKITGLQDGTANDHAASKGQMDTAIAAKAISPGFITLDGSGNGSAAFLGWRPMALFVTFFKSGKTYTADLLLPLGAPGVLNGAVIEFNNADLVTTRRAFTVDFSDSSPYITVAAGAALAGADCRFVAHRFAPT